MHCRHQQLYTTRSGLCSSESYSPDRSWLALENKLKRGSPRTNKQSIYDKSYDSLVETKIRLNIQQRHLEGDLPIIFVIWDNEYGWTVSVKVVKWDKIIVVNS